MNVQVDCAAHALISNVNELFDCAAHTCNALPGKGGVPVLRIHLQI